MSSLTANQKLSTLGAGMGGLTLISLACAPTVLDFGAAVDGKVDIGGQGGAISDRGQVPIPPDAPQLQVTGKLDLSTYNTPPRSCADGGEAVAYDVEHFAREKVQLAQIPDTGCLAAGDEVLLIELQGDPADTGRVGQYELLRISEVEGDTLSFVALPLLNYGPASAKSLGEWQGRVVVQRVPSFSRLTVNSAAVLVGGDWNQGGTGVLSLRVLGDAVVDGEISMSGRGYRGGSATNTPETTGQQGESIAGPGVRSTENNFGAGGGGLGDQTESGCVQNGNSGGGGANQSKGQDAFVSDLCDSAGRGRGGASTLLPGRLVLGSGGGSGGSDNVLVDNPPGAQGGAGGGVVLLLGQSLSGTGKITASGESGGGDALGVECVSGGSVKDCYDHSGAGGGGGGGTIVLQTIQVSGVTLDASGGRGGNGYDSAGGNGGDGGDGLIVGG